MMIETNKIYVGDCIEVMKTWPENFVDTVITDPPYGLDFMGKDWDGDVPGVHFWAEMLRVCKPGATLLSFGGTRTWHHLATAIERAGWQIRDCLMWLYGSGFPKSLDISKAIDKAKDAENVVGSKPDRWTGRGNSLNFSTDRPQIECKVTAPASDLAKQWSGWGTALKPAWEPIIVAMKPIDGTFAENAERWGVAGINVDGGRIGTGEKLVRPQVSRDDNTAYGKGLGVGTQTEPQGRWPANLILDEDAAAMLDGQSGESRSNFRSNAAAHARNRSGLFGMVHNGAAPNDSGGASRFFYVAKSARAERNEGCENGHPTVKPLSLMKYLCQLTRTPTGGIVLDPFCGSGTTLWAAEFHNRPWIGIEMNPEYVAIANARIARERSQIKMAI